MIDISAWIDNFLQALRAAFGERVWFVGLQGSYARGEATEGSDIDAVVILDELSYADIKAYNAMLDTLPHRDLTCGFLAGKDELLSWEPSDLFQFYYDTKPIKGNLDAILPLIDGAAIKRSIKLGACSIYHGCVHNMLYDKSEEILRGLYKSASFVIGAITFLETGKHIGCRTELIKMVSTDHKDMLDTLWRLKNGASVDFDTMSEKLFYWAKSAVEKWDDCDGIS